MADGDPEVILRGARTIAVVGLSSNPMKASYGVARYLQAHGYRIIPVNPREREVLGETAYATVAAIPERVDLVDVFRVPEATPEATPEVARDAVRAGAGALWLQLGIRNPETRRIAEEGGLAYVEDQCTKIVHATMRRD